MSNLYLNKFLLLFQDKYFYFGIKSCKFCSGVISGELPVNPTTTLFWSLSHARNCAVCQYPLFFLIPTWRTPLRGSTNTKILIALLHLYLELIFWTSPGRGDRGSLTYQAVSMAFRPCRLQIPRFLEGYTNSH